MGKNEKEYEEGNRKERKMRMEDSYVNRWGWKVSRCVLVISRFLKKLCVCRDKENKGKEEKIGIERRKGEENGNKTRVRKKRRKGDQKKKR